MPSHSTNAPTHEEIAERARHIWQEAGRPEGRDEENWLQAERELREVNSQNGNNSSARSSADVGAPSTSAKTAKASAPAAPVATDKKAKNKTPAKQGQLAGVR